MTLKSEMECQESTNNSPSKILILTTNRMTIARCFVLSLSYTKKKGRKFCPELIYQVTDFLSNKIDATYYQGTLQCPTRKMAFSDKICRDSNNLVTIYALLVTTFNVITDEMT